MKTVFTDISQVAHLWANQLQDSARNSGNYFFNKDAIYSYGHHFMIAKHHENKKGKVVLFTTRTYSNTTSTQVSVTRQACSHKELIYCSNPDGISHEDNFKVWQANIENHARSLVNARKPEKYLNAISYEFKQAEVYAKYFGLKLPKGLILANSITTKEDYLKFDAKKIALAKKEEKQRIANSAKQHAIELAKWRNNEVNRLYTHDGFDYLRIDSVKNRLVTSQNVEIPMEVAKKFYGYVLDTIKNGGCTNCNAKLMDYSVRAISDKLVSVGCHNVTIGEINTIASQLNW